MNMPVADPYLQLEGGGGGGGTFEDLTMNVEFCEDISSSEQKMFQDTHLRNHSHSKSCLFSHILHYL